jgi:hypothetical protein
MRAPLAAAALALSLTTGPASAHLPANDPLPTIGSAAYDRGCLIVRHWEDDSALAYCREDGSWYRYDPTDEPRAGRVGGIWTPLPATSPAATPAP